MSRKDDPERYNILLSGVYREIFPPRADDRKCSSLFDIYDDNPSGLVNANVGLSHELQELVKGNGMEMTVDQEAA